MPEPARAAASDGFWQGSPPCPSQRAKGAPRAEPPLPGGGRGGSPGLAGPAATVCALANRISESPGRQPGRTLDVSPCPSA